MDSNLSKSFAIAKMPTPLLNSSDFQTIFGGHDGASLSLDDQGLIRAVEAIALKGTKMTILDRLGSFIFRVKTADYPGQDLYVDLRFLEISDESVPEREKVLPHPDKILTHMHSLLGSTYIWGGNWSRGIPQLLAFYPPCREIDHEMQTLWSLKGVDCSGLLYESTNGFTPRNTSELISYGKPLPIEGKSAKEIAALLQPLDLIVWKGHVFIAFDRHHVIESRKGKGVVITRAEERLEELMHDRKPINNFAHLDPKSFVINRW
jgi:hypothetical protein